MLCYSYREYLTNPIDHLIHFLEQTSVEFQHFVYHRIFLSVFVEVCSHAYISLHFSYVFRIEIVKNLQK